MHKAFFASALALPQLTSAGLTQDNGDFAPLLAAQIVEGISMVNEFVQTDAEEDAEFWNTYLSQVDAVLEEEANPAYWTDGFTSLSQAEVEALVENDTGVAAWGQKGGLAQLAAGEYDKNKANILQRAAHKTNKRAHEGAHAVAEGMRHLVADVHHRGDMAIDKLGTIKMPSLPQVKEYLKHAKAVSDKAGEIKTKGLNFQNIAGQVMSKKLSDAATVVSVISTVIPGASTLSDIAAFVADGTEGVGLILERFNTPDDGKKKTCWVKSAMRKFELPNLRHPKPCVAPRVPGVGGICYNACEAGQGKGLGPVCWGQCDALKHDTCGPLCLLKTDEVTCKEFVAKVGYKALSVGAQAAAGNYIGAVFGAISIAGKLAYPICKNFNTPVGFVGEHEESGSGEI